MAHKWAEMGGYDTFYVGGHDLYRLVHGVVCALAGPRRSQAAGEGKERLAVASRENCVRFLDIAEVTAKGVGPESSHDLNIGRSALHGPKRPRSRQRLGFRLPRTSASA